MESKIKKSKAYKRGRKFAKSKKGREGLINALEHAKQVNDELRESARIDPEKLDRPITRL